MERNKPLLTFSSALSSDLLLQLDGIFTTTECKYLINFSESHGFDLVDRGFAIYNRVVSRVNIYNIPLNRFLEEKLSEYIPKYIEGKRVIGINEIFRFSKYEKGQLFDIHKDGINQDPQGNRSIHTLNIFLNDNFEGGETDFFNSDNRSDLKFSVKPLSGRGALFHGQQFHCGNELKSGTKYLIRTDVMVSDF
jgi:prolyl 4-hydroxylase